ncbi:MAG: hypothetical protein KGL39_52420, partial [Patescibacteria group bacterium]|nr:hypothetical protein [Patescibacteria group bacterium]
QIVKIGYSVAGSTPVQVSSSAPLPVVQTGALPAGSNSIGTVVLGAGSAAIGSVIAGGNVASGAADSGNPVKIGGVYNAAPITLTTGQRGDAQLDASGNLCVNIKAGAGSGGTALSDGTAFTRGTTSETPVAARVESAAPTLTSGQSGVLSMDTSGNLRVTVSNGINSGTAGAPNSQVLSTQNIAQTPYHLVSAATTNATNITAAVGLARVVSAINNGAGWAYLKIFDKATAPVPGTDTPVLSLGIPPGGGTNPAVEFKLTAGLGIAITGGAADNDTTAVTAAQVIVNLVHS